MRLAGGLLLGGFLIIAVVTRFHPSGHEDDHPVIFVDYADSDPWIAVHIGQLVGVFVLLSGFLVLHRAIARRGVAPLLTACALAAAALTGALFAVLQALDGVALKHTVDAWHHASGPERDLRFADAETLRWLEWGLQSYFRMLLGLTVGLFGLAILRSGIVARWLGWLAGLIGALYVATGVAVGYEGLESPGDPVVQVLFVVFAVGIIIAGRDLRDDEPVRS